ncbi:MAG: hypothetical protein ACR2OH_10130, partial [Microthrixaceae bacterium]
EWAIIRCGRFGLGESVTGWERGLRERSPPSDAGYHRRPASCIVAGVSPGAGHRDFRTLDHTLGNHIVERLEACASMRLEWLN